MSTTLSPEIAALRDKVEEHSKELAEMRGNLHQLDKIIGATVRQSIWQLIALIVSLFVAIAGGLAYQTSMIDKRIDQIDKRFEQSDKNSGDRFEMLEQRIEQSEKNMTTRFEDLESTISGTTYRRLCQWKLEHGFAGLMCSHRCIQETPRYSLP